MRVVYIPYIILLIYYCGIFILLLVLLVYTTSFRPPWRVVAVGGVFCCCCGFGFTFKGMNYEHFFLDFFRSLSSLYLFPESVYDEYNIRVKYKYIVSIVVYCCCVCKIYITSVYDSSIGVSKVINRYIDIVRVL